MLWCRAVSTEPVSPVATVCTRTSSEISRLLVAFACLVSLFLTPVSFYFESSFACVSVSSSAFLSFSFALPLSIACSIHMVVGWLWLKHQSIFSLYLPFHLCARVVLVGLEPQMCCQLWRRLFGYDGFLGRLVEHGSSCDFLVFPESICTSFQCWQQIFDIGSFGWSQCSQRRANAVHLRLWIESVFSCRHAARPLPQLPWTMDRGSPALCARMDACRASSSSFCPFQRCDDACLYGSENSSDVVAPVVISAASELLDPDFFSCFELMLLLLCCKPLLGLPPTT